VLAGLEASERLDQVPGDAVAGLDHRPVGPQLPYLVTRSRSRVPPAALEPAAYRLGGRASVAVFGLVSAPLRDHDTGSSRISPAPAAVARWIWHRCADRTDGPLAWRRSAVENSLDHDSVSATRTDWTIHCGRRARRARASSNQYSVSAERFPPPLLLQQGPEVDHGAGGTGARPGHVVVAGPPLQQHTETRRPPSVARVDFWTQRSLASRHGAAAMGQLRPPRPTRLSNGDHGSPVTTSVG